MKQHWNETKMQLYHFQPGDGTRYIFGLVDLDRLPGDPKDFFPGADHSYVVIVPFVPQGQPYPFDKHALLSPFRALCWYAKEKMGLHEHTCAALILAAGTLLQTPTAHHLAVRRMLLAPQLLNGDDVAGALRDAAETHRIEQEVAIVTL